MDATSLSPVLAPSPKSNGMKHQRLNHATSTRPTNLSINMDLQNIVALLTFHKGSANASNPNYQQSHYINAKLNNKLHRPFLY
jgi:hypothetical protein